MKQKKNFTISTTMLVVIVLCLSLGYAFLTTNLSINGIANIDRNTWNVYWDNIQVSSGSVEAETPTIDTNKTTVSFHARLSKPGDYYEFTVDAKNDGTMDAMIGSMNATVNGNPISYLPVYLNYSITYADGEPLAESQELKSNEKETYKIRLEFKRDITANELPSSGVSITLTEEVEYEQADDTATTVSHPQTVYVGNIAETIELDGETPTLLRFGNEIPSSFPVYQNPEEALLALRQETGDNTNPFFGKLVLRDNKISEAYIGFEITPEEATRFSGVKAGTYYVRGLDTEEDGTLECKSEYYNATSGECISPYYEANNEIMKEAFGTENCYSKTYGNEVGYECEFSDKRKLINAKAGYVYFLANCWYMTVGPTNEIRISCNP